MQYVRELLQLGSRLTGRRWLVLVVSVLAPVLLCIGATLRLSQFGFAGTAEAADAAGASAACPGPGPAPETVHTSAEETSLIFGNGKGLDLAGAALATGNANSSVAYQLQQSRWSPQVLGRIKHGGFDFIRLVTTPTPLLTADPAAQRCALSWIATQVDQANDAGLGVIVDLHFWSSDKPLSQDNVPIAPNSRDALIRGEVAIAKMLAGKLHQRVAMELLNEPFCAPATGPSSWPALQARLVHQVRHVAPDLPLILTGCRGRPSMLLQMDASPYAGDANIYWTFHYYDFFGSQETLSLRSVPFPPRPELASSMPQILTMVPAATLAQNPRVVGQLRDYLLNHHGQATIRADMERIAAWARSQGVRPDHVFMGEFAPLLTDRRENESVRGDQLRWIAAVREEAERQGFPWAYWITPEPTHLNYDPATHFFRQDALEALGVYRSR